jgi:hypothetical protein
VDANTATLIGPTRRGATFRRGYPNYVFIRGDDFALNWPDAKGHQFEILTGPNAGVHTIVNLRDPETLADFDLLPNGSQKAMVTGAAGLLAAGNEISENHSTYVVELNNSTAFEGDDDEATWRIVPVFPTDVGPIVAEIVDASSHAGVNLTLRQALPLGISGGWTPLVSVEYTRVLSGQIQDETDRLANDDFWPAFLFDAFGLLRQVIEEITAAGVWADFDSLFVDDAGMHVIEE